MALLITEAMWDLKIGSFLIRGKVFHEVLCILMRQLMKDLLNEQNEKSTGKLGIRWSLCRLKNEFLRLKIISISKSSKGNCPEDPLTRFLGV